MCPHSGCAETPRSRPTPGHPSTHRHCRCSKLPARPQISRMKSPRAGAAHSPAVVAAAVAGERERRSGAVTLLHTHAALAGSLAVPASPAGFGSHALGPLAPQAGAEAGAATAVHAVVVVAVAVRSVKWNRATLPLLRQQPQRWQCQKVVCNRLRSMADAMPTPGRSQLPLHWWSVHATLVLRAQRMSVMTAGGAQVCWHRLSQRGPASFAVFAPGHAHHAAWQGHCCCCCCCCCCHRHHGPSPAVWPLCSSRPALALGACRCHRCRRCRGGAAENPRTQTAAARTWDASSVGTLGARLLRL